MASVPVWNNVDEKKDMVKMLRPLSSAETDVDSFRWNCTDFENLEDLRIIWLDENILTTADRQCTIEKLCHIISYLQIFTNAELCIDYIRRTQTDKIFFIVSNRLKNVIKNVHNFLTAVYIFCMKDFDISHDWQMSELTKIRGVFTNINQLTCQLSKDVLIIVKQIPMTLFEITKYSERTTTAVHDQAPSYIWWHILIRSLAGCKSLDTINAKHQLIEECKLYYKNNRCELRKIKEFDETYSSTDSVKWYTYDSFLYRLLNKALRTQDIDIVFKFRFFLHDLYHQLYKEHLHLVENLPDKVQVYRGQRMDSSEIHTLKLNSKKHVSMNTFLSTTMNRNIALAFAGESNILTESVLFEITLYTKMIKTPFAMVKDSAEEEVLISIGAVFVINSVVYDSTNRIWNVKLDLTENVDDKLEKLIEHYNFDGSFFNIALNRSRIDASETSMNTLNEDYTYLLSFGFFLWRMGQEDKAEHFWNMAYRSKDFNTFHWSEKHQLFMFLSMLYRTKDDNKALEYYKLAIKILLEQPRHDRLWFAIGNILREIGHIYIERKQYDVALKKLELAKRFIRSTVYGDKMVLYSSIDTSFGILYYRQRKYEKALEYFNEAYKLQIQNLPEYHPETALTVHYIGTVYDALKNVTASINALQKALEIMSVCYSWNHESILSVHIDLATVYNKSNDLSASIQHFETALRIAKSIFPFNHNQLISLYKLLGNNYSKMFYHWLYKIRDQDVAQLYQRLLIELTEQCPIIKSSFNLQQIDRDLQLFPSQLDSTALDRVSITTTIHDHNNVATTAITGEIKGSLPVSSPEKTIEQDSATTKCEDSVKVLENSIFNLTAAGIQPLHTLKYYRREEIIGTVLRCVAFFSGCEYDTFPLSQIKNCFLRGFLTPRYVGVSNEWTLSRYSNVALCLSSLQQKDFCSFEYENNEFRQSFQKFMIKYLIPDGQYSDISHIDRIRQLFELAIESGNPVHILEAYTLESEFYHRIYDDFNQLHPMVIHFSIGRGIASLFRYHSVFRKRTYNGRVYRWMKMLRPKLDESPNFHFINMKFMVKSLLSTTKFINKNSPIWCVLMEEDNGIYNNDAYQLVLCEFILTKKDIQTSAIDVDTLSIYPDEGEVLILPYTVFQITLDETMINKQCSFVRLEEQLAPRDCHCSHCESNTDEQRIIVTGDTQTSEAAIQAVLQRHREKTDIVNKLTMEDIINP